MRNNGKQCKSVEKIVITIFFWKSGGVNEIWRERERDVHLMCGEKGTEVSTHVKVVLFALYFLFCLVRSSNYSSGKKVEIAKLKLSSAVLLVVCDDDDDNGT